MLIALPNRDRRPARGRTHARTLQGRKGLLLISAVWSGFWLSAASQGQAAEPVAVRPGTSEPGTIEPAAGPARTGPIETAPSLPSGSGDGILHRETLLGDMGGLRTALGRYGVTLTLTDTSDVLGNVSGGIDRGATYSGLTTLILQMDTQKAFGWEGGLFNVSGAQIRGRSLTQYYLASLQGASGIAADPTTRFLEIWYQQAFANGVYDVRLGQQMVEQEFIQSDESALFLNAAMGWPVLPGSNLYAGGSGFPLSSLGIRLRAQVTPEVTVLAGVFQDNPPGGPFHDDGQLRGSTRWGGNFNLRTGALFIAEVQYALNHPGSDENLQDIANGLPGTYKLGAWFDTAAFPNQRYDTMGVPLASPASNGIPQMNQHNFSFYGLADQVIWRPDPKGARAVGLFARAMGGPDDRNLISFSANAGVTLRAPLPGRDDDTFGVGFGIANVSRSASGFDQDTNFYGSAPYPVPVRGVETFLEVTYQIQVTPWLQIQPDFQYIFNPGGGIANPNNPALRVKNEAVFGVRTGVVF